ncbi:MAG: insulinase family protein [Spirochaetia bacterium]|nr:insulinase family protein [Spirochaetia bacterium]
MKKFLIFLILVSISVLTIYAEIAPDTLLTPDPAITLGRLDNGLTYYIRPNSYPDNEVYLRLVVKAGSLMEDDDQQGLAHFLEHMAFNGTEKYSENQVISFLEKNGIKFGPDLNAYTTYDQTVFMLNIPADNPMLIEQSVEILSQWAGYMKLDPKEIDAERGVIIEEWRRGQGAEERFYRFEVEKVEGGRFALRDPIGKVDILNTFSRDQLMRYYKEWYTPDRMAVMVIGNVDVEFIKSSIEKYFSPLGNNAQSRTIDMSSPINEGTISGVMTDPEATFNKFTMHIKVPFKQDKTAIDYKGSIIRALFCNMFSDRLDQIKRELDPPFLNSGVGFSHIFSSASSYFLTTTLKDDNAEEGIVRSVSEIARIAQHGFTQSELDRSKAELFSFIETAYNEQDKTHSSSLINEYTRNFMQDECIPGIAVEYELYKQFLPSITLNDVNSLVQIFLKKNGRILIATGKPQSLASISEDRLLDIVDKALESKQEPYKEIALSDTLVDSLPPAGKVKSSRTDKKTSLTTLKLSNGAKVLLYPTDYKNDQILISAISQGGSSLVSDSQWASSLISCALVGNSGLGHFPKVELDQMLKGKNVAISPFIETYSEGFTGSSNKKDLETAFQLIHLYFTAPRFDQEAYESYMKRLETAVKSQESDPDSAFIKAVKELITQGHKRGRFMDMELLSEISLKDAQDVFKARFRDPGDFTFILVGNIDIDKVKELFSAYIASIPSAGTKEKWADVGLRILEGTHRQDVYKGIDFKSQVLTILDGNIRYNSKELLNLEALSYCLNQRLMEVIREKLGGTYTIQAYSSTTPIPVPQYMLNIIYSCSPLRADELMLAVDAEIEKLKQEIPQEYLDQFKAIQLNEYNKGLKDNSWYLAQLTDCAFYNSRFKLDSSFPKALEKLTVKALKKKSLKYFDTKNSITVVLFPEQ